MYADEYKGFSGGGNQFAAMLKQSPALPGNRLPLKNHRFVQSYTWAPNASGNRGGYIRYNNKMPYNRNSKSFKLPAMGGLLNIALIGGAVYIGYKLLTSVGGGISSIFSSPQSVASGKGDAALAATFVSDNQAKADTLTATASSLNSAGYGVSSLHQGIANTLHGDMDTWWVNDDEIVNIIKQESIPTFQLVSVAYGTRNLNTWWDTHPFNANFWSPVNMVSSNQDTGTLSDHLKLTLSSSALAEISQYLGAIS